MRKTDDVNEMDKLWLNTLLAIIGENFTDEDEVNGVVISLRKGRNRIGLWTKHDHAKVAQRVGAEWKKILMLPQTQRIGFTSHSQAMKSRDIQNLYTV
jgi:translation initiation factor 4E